MKLIYYVVVSTIFSYNLVNAAELDEKLRADPSSRVSVKDRQASLGEVETAVDADVVGYTLKLETEKSKGKEASPSLIEYYQEYLESFKALQGKIKAGEEVDISQERFAIHEKHNMYAGGFL